MRTPLVPLLVPLLAACGPGEPRAPHRVDDAVTVGPLHFAHGVPKNLIMISMDTFRRDHFGRYAEGESLTPFMDSLVAEGVVLDDFSQCSDWTFNSVSCTLSGRDHVDAGFYPRFGTDIASPWPEGTPFLAGHLERAGFDSYLYSVNGWLGEEWGSSQGYDREMYPGILYTKEILRRAANDLEEHIAGKDDPWFFHVHVIEPHAPYRTPLAFSEEYDALPELPYPLDEQTDHYDLVWDAWDGLDEQTRDLAMQHLHARYRAEIRWLDAQLEERFADLDARGLLDDALVVFWTDHGEAFFEHGYQSHAYTLHGEETDAIAFFWAKRGLAPAVWSEPVRSVDLTPTLLALYGVEPTIELAGYPLGEAPADRIRYASTVGRIGPQTSAERDGLKLIFDWEKGVTAYDRTTDPGETIDIWDPTDPAQAELWEALRVRAEAEDALVADFDVTWP